MLAEFKKLTFGDSKEISLDELVKQPQEEDLELAEKCKSLWNEVSGKDEFFRPFDKPRSRKGSDDIPTSALINAKEFEKFLRQASKRALPGEWSLGFMIRSEKMKSGVRIVVSLENRSEKQTGDFRENAFFECVVSVRIVGSKFVPFELDYLDEDYKHDRTIVAQGVNCTALKVSEDKILTQHLPVFKELRSTPKAPTCLEFDKLIADPIANLREAASLLQTAISELDLQNAGSRPAGQIEAFEADRRATKNELSRFVQGIETLARYQDVGKAFSLMCLAFRRSSKRIRGWRLFQAVFIVSLLPDMVAPRYPLLPNSRASVDLLFYPTGGGKTEAFLGLAIFQAFFDRIHGKGSGVTAIAKFPLRMLSIQQLQRIADAFAAAEMVRRENSELFPAQSEPFSIGYYVGERNTPNELEDWDAAKRSYSLQRLSEWAANPDLAQRFLVVSRCPFCSSEGVKIKADPAKVRLYHICPNHQCPSGGQLPIYISDNEIYRYLPTFLVSTLDKMVTCGHQKKFRNILGQVFYRCSLHGYSSEPKCAVKTCGFLAKDMERIKLKDPLPSLMIQDELHLVRDSLGCFASHYETFFDYLATRLAENHECVKIVGATATASNYYLHVRQLYLREPIKFPSNLEIFADKTDKIARLTLGIMPHGKTSIFVMEQVITTLRSEIEKLSRLSGSEIAEVLEIDQRRIAPLDLSDFRTILSYHIRKIDSEQLNRSVWTRMNPWLSENGYPELSYRSLNGDVGFDEVRDVMSQIEQPDSQNGIGLLTATSVISHGIDIDRLNLMAFMGMPSSNAEYVQARSRIARRNSGLAVVVFIPGRERDQSYYKYFVKFHELFDIMIEPIPINRWAPLAVSRTAVGIFGASIYNYFDLLTTRDKDRPIWKVNWFRRALSDKLLTQDDVMNFVLESYGTGTLEGSIKDYIENMLKTKVDSLITTVLTTNDRMSNITMVLDPPPLRSLRDVGSDVTIELNSESRSIVDGFKINADISGA